MPYQGGDRLPGERASKLGHLDVLDSELVKALVNDFESRDDIKGPVVKWEDIKTSGTELPFIFGVDGSLSFIISDYPPHKRIAYVKTALLRLDKHALSKIDKDNPHPLALKDLMANSAIYHATIFPLSHVVLHGRNTYDTIRYVIFESLKDKKLNGEIFETLKWIAYEKWSGQQKQLPKFECPHCEVRDAATLPYDADKGNCPNCGKEILLTDMLGFHLEMAPDSAPDGIVNTYMLLHETLMLFTAIRFFWQNKKEVLLKCLFIKDGSLSIRAQYSKLVEPIRKFLAYANENGYPINLIGQEKTGIFVEHLAIISKDAPDGHIFIPNDKYIKENIQHRPSSGAEYGADTNYAAKVFVNFSKHHKMVLMITTGSFNSNPQISDLIGYNDIFATIPTLLSSRYESGLLPIELANGIASLSTYPSAHILKLFTETYLGRT